MSKEVYHPPTLEASAFNCPHCRVFAKQKWYHLQASSSPSGFGIQIYDKKFMVSVCEGCAYKTIWLNDKIVFPRTLQTVPANADLPEDIKADYNEAALIANDSPRGAAALLRLCVQKLCKHLDLPGKNINDDIANLVKQGVSSSVQQALDTVRVIGNSAVHPGELSVGDSPETVMMLFKILNYIAEKTLTDKRMVEELFNDLPQKDRDNIARRDGKP